MSTSIDKKTLVTGLFLVFMSLTAGCSTTGSLPPENADHVEIGYGSINPEQVTGAVSTARIEDTENAPIRNAADILRGRAAGVEVSAVPGGGLSVRVRGANSFIGGNAPLYVVDGFTVRTTNGVLYGINPHDIESITVLKDAASTAIYGSRGANGVVLIKTKI